jgi:hypothetical protein
MANRRISSKKSRGKGKKLNRRGFIKYIGLALSAPLSLLSLSKAKINRSCAGTATPHKAKVEIPPLSEDRVHPVESYYYFSRKPLRGMQQLSEDKDPQPNMIRCGMFWWDGKSDYNFDCGFIPDFVQIYRVPKVEGRYYFCALKCN